ncbi:hypothetical protein A2973_01465 [Candidatus Gottesmanbacteria bacterium RIFCSPLOWO2_01_FULL_49_10]|uniref:Large ribosomal subunit protein bL25 n=1 Tax=Candidatus Gottesmanbacteria bacterium RIFCSPLOWO2_01_FULL_49_10 TaxID=1798396 RepID=A0A1F6B192_9BACT|nr:MAG: hypothetical protein A2973_01465 [Candidatus Gottesmanbacteria bacterium RIFCSPLOWO2_01_FULL_49_10]
MKKYTIQATKRSVIGRKVKNLRAQGTTPGTVYGRNIKSVSLAVATEEFIRVYKEAGETGLIELSIEKDTRPVLVHHVQKDPVSGQLLHIEFHEVNLKEKVHAKVPIVLSGLSPAVAEKRGVLLTILDEVEVEALPMDLVDKIEVDVSGLSEVNQEVKVGGLTVPAGLAVVSDRTLTVVKVGSLVTREAEAEEAAATAAAAAAQTAQAPAAEGGTAPTAEGEAPADLPASKAGKPKEEAKEDKKEG